MLRALTTGIKSNGVKVVGFIVKIGLNMLVRLSSNAVFPGSKCLPISVEDKV